MRSGAGWPQPGLLPGGPRQPPPQGWENVGPRKCGGDLHSTRRRSSLCRALVSCAFCHLQRTGERSLPGRKPRCSRPICRVTGWKWTPVCFFQMNRVTHSTGRAACMPLECVKLTTAPPSSPCPAQGHHVALPRPPSCSGQSWVLHASPCTPSLLTSEVPEWGGAGGLQAGKSGGKIRKSQPSKEGGCLGLGGFTAFLQTAENFRWPELRQAAETLRSLSRRDERGNCGIFITRQLGLREAY